MSMLAALLMTDIVGSTRLWVDHETAMAADLALHDAVLREVVEACSGQVVKHTGDGMIAVFADPATATEAALGVQRALAAAAWTVPSGITVRAAVHSGVVHRRDDDLFGTAMNRVARLLGACPPGAVLVSAAAASLCAERLPTDRSLVPVGVVHLAGFGAPEEVYALVADGVAVVDGLQGDKVTVDVGNLPSIDDELIGRDSDLGTIWEALDRHRLVTLVGVGGMGKTRLALEAAAGMSRPQRGAAWWIDLSAATSDESVVPVAAAALGAREQAGRSLLESVVDRLGAAAALVVIDNCEHVLTAARDLVQTLRSGCPGTRLLCTSREALGVRGEEPVAIGSMPLDDAISLFTERARVARSGVVVDDERSVVADICRRLDGIPLAIELAAARCRSMSSADILDRLDDRFRLLRSGRSGAERHRTLQAAVAWSYSMLDDAERVVFDSLAVFAGGTLLDGLAAVTELDELDVLDVVDRLIARSMVVATDTPWGVRYRQLETLRQYGEDRLVEAGTIGITRDRHLAWVVDLARRIAASSGTTTAHHWYGRFDVEIDNVRVAVAHAVACDHLDDARRIVGDLNVCVVYRPVYEVIDWFDPADGVVEWTEAAISAVSTRGLLEFLRGDGGALRRWLSPIPADRRRTSMRSVVNEVWQAALVDGQFDAADGVLDAYTPHGAFAGLVRERFRVFVASMRAESRQLTPEQADVAVVHAMATIEQVRRRGDLLELAFLLGYASALFTHCGRIDEGVAAAREAMSIAAPVGAGMIVDATRTHLGISLAALAGRDGGSPATVAGELHAALVDSATRGSHMFAVFMGPAVFDVVRPFDGETAVLIALSAHRTMGALRPADDIAREDPALLARAAARAADVSPRELVGVMLEALECVITAASSSG